MSHTEVLTLGALLERIKVLEDQVHRLRRDAGMHTVFGPGPVIPRKAPDPFRNVHFQPPHPVIFEVAPFEAPGTAGDVPQMPTISAGDVPRVLLIDTSDDAS